MALIMERAGECGAFGAPGEPVCQRRCHPGQGRPLGSPGPRDTEEDVLISGSEASSGDLRRLSSHGHGRRGGKVFCSLLYLPGIEVGEEEGMSFF